MWLLFVFVSIMFYALGEMFQKKGSDLTEEHTELKILIWFGIAGGITSLFISLFGLKESSVTVVQMVSENPAVILSPALYYFSLLLCFLAFKLVPVCVASPITCMDGVFTFVGIIVMYLIIGKSALIDESITPLKLILVVLIFAGIYICTYIQSKHENIEENKQLANNRLFIKNGRFAFIGVGLALLSALADAGSSLTDIYFLGELSDSFDYIYTHGMLVFYFTVILYFVLWIIRKKPYNLFSKKELPKILGAGFDSLGMVFYMIAVSRNQIYTNVLISGFCIFTVLLSRVFLKEKLAKNQFLWIGFTIACIIAFAAVDEML